MIFCLAGQEGGDDQLIKMTCWFVVYKVLLQTHFLRETLKRWEEQSIILQIWKHLKSQGYHKAIKWNSVRCKPESLSNFSCKQLWFSCFYHHYIGYLWILVFRFPGNTQVKNVRFIASDTYIFSLQNYKSCFLWLDILKGLGSAVRTEDLEKQVVGPYLDLTCRLRNSRGWVGPSNSWEALKGILRLLNLRTMVLIVYTFVTGWHLTFSCLIVLKDI